MAHSSNSSEINNNPSEDDSSLDEYRKMLEGYAFQAANAYDKAIMSLSGGALGVSFAFVKNIVTTPAPDTVIWLCYAWISLGISLASIIVSMLFSQKAIRIAIQQVDDGTIYSKKPGGFCSLFTVFLAWFSGICFVAGVALLAYFAKINLILG